MPLLSKPLLERVVPSVRMPNPAAGRTLREAAERKLKSNVRFDIFLSHRFIDAIDILRLTDYLDELGYVVFVDWIESPELNRERVTKKTAAYLRKIMDRSDSLLFAASNTSPESKWMPWELGYFDGSNGRVAIAPIFDWETTSEIYSGQEYLSLYPYITLTPDKLGEDTLWVNATESKFVTFEDWMDGAKP